MAQNLKHRRSLMTPESQCSPSLRNHCLQLPATTFHRLNTIHELRTLSNPTNLQQRPLPASVDIHFHANALNLPGDVDYVAPLQKLALAQGTEKQRKMEEPSMKASSAFDDLESGRGVAEEVVDMVKFDKQPRVRFCDKAELTTRRNLVSSSVTGGVRNGPACGLQVKLGEAFASNGVKVVSVDMPPFMQIHAVDCARKAYDSLEKVSCKSLALTLKKEFDGAYGPAWHCIVGANFGSFVTHSVGGFMYFSMKHKMYILLFKTSVERAK
ncbi:hypothetical protein SAY87_003893 [Trapa incisa]|uniref:Dynein light chain n=1 Tax=Trapa incisa TaxID=236973 RepID=A0AAN7JMZ8_9MYRT|nr:hypothetical protein SAY87_003893 [Trapa incisa]